VSAPITVACDDLEVRRWVEDWVASSRLAPPTALTVALRIVADASPGPVDGRTPFLQPQIEIRSGPPQGDVRIRWLAGPARATIAPGSRTAEVELGASALLEHEPLAQSFLQTVLIFLLRRAGWQHVHAAVARDPVGRAWLFAGNAQAGKSTTAALLATKGWAVGGDDSTFLVANDGSVEAVAQRAPIALRPHGHALLSAPVGAAVRGGRKTAFFPEELGGTWAQRVTPQILILPRVEGEVTRAEPVRPRDALVELVRWSAWVALEPELAQEHLGLLTTLAGQARCYRLALGPDLFADRDLLMELIP
jgi:hypothetical protein